MQVSTEYVSAPINNIKNLINIAKSSGKLTPEDLGPINEALAEVQETYNPECAPDIVKLIDRLAKTKAWLAGKKNKFDEFNYKSLNEHVEKAIETCLAQLVNLQDYHEVFRLIKELLKNNTLLPPTASHCYQFAFDSFKTLNNKIKQLGTLESLEKNFSNAGDLRQLLQDNMNIYFKHIDYEIARLGTTQGKTFSEQHAANEKVSTLEKQKKQGEENISVDLQDGFGAIIAACYDTAFEFKNFQKAIEFLDLAKRENYLDEETYQQKYYDCAAAHLTILLLQGNHEDAKKYIHQLYKTLSSSTFNHLISQSLDELLKQGRFSELRLYTNFFNQETTINVEGDLKNKILQTIYHILYKMVEDGQLQEVFKYLNEGSKYKNLIGDESFELKLKVINSELLIVLLKQNRYDEIKNYLDNLNTINPNIKERDSFKIELDRLITKEIHILLASHRYDDLKKIINRLGSYVLDPSSIANLLREFVTEQIKSAQGEEIIAVTKDLYRLITTAGQFEALQDSFFYLFEDFISQRPDEPDFVIEIYNLILKYEQFLNPKKQEDSKFVYFEDALNEYLEKYAERSLSVNQSAITLVEKLDDLSRSENLTEKVTESLDLLSAKVYLISARESLQKSGITDAEQNISQAENLLTKYGLSVNKEFYITLIKDCYYACQERCEAGDLENANSYMTAAQKLMNKLPKANQQDFDNLKIKTNLLLYLTCVKQGVDGENYRKSAEEKLFKKKVDPSILEIYLEILKSDVTKIIQEFKLKKLEDYNPDNIHDLEQFKTAIVKLEKMNKGWISTNKDQQQAFLKIKTRAINASIPNQSPKDLPREKLYPEVQEAKYDLEADIYSPQGFITPSKSEKITERSMYTHVSAFADKDSAKGLLRTGQSTYKDLNNIYKEPEQKIPSEPEHQKSIYNIGNIYEKEREVPSEKTSKDQEQKEAKPGVGHIYSSDLFPKVPDKDPSEVKKANAEPEKDKKTKQKQRGMG